MTTPTLTARRALGAAAAVSTLPYVALKIVWLGGNPVGITDPALATGPGMAALNAVTVLLDLAVVALAVALGSRRSPRLPALAVLLPSWVATGLLVPVALVSLPLTLLHPAAAATGMAGWVRPMVYGGFAVQAVCLLAAFALYAAERWGGRVLAPGPVPDGVRPLLRAVAGGGAVVGALAAALHLLAAVLDGGGPASFAATVVPVLLILGGVAGTGALAAGRSGPVVVVAAWTGSAVAFANGLYTVSVTMAATVFGGPGSPAAGMAQVTSLLAGFALAVAALLAVSGARTAAVAVG